MHADRKDRSRVIEIFESECWILYRSSSSLPTEYALMLMERGPDGDRAIRSADNAHHRAGTPEHHQHRYRDGKKRKAEPLPFEIKQAGHPGTKEAVGKIISWYKTSWESIKNDS